MEVAGGVPSECLRPLLCAVQSEVEHLVLHGPGQKPQGELPLTTTATTISSRGRGRGRDRHRDRVGDRGFIVFLISGSGQGGDGGGSELGRSCMGRSAGQYLLLWSCQSLRARPHPHPQALLRQQDRRLRRQVLLVQGRVGRGKGTLI